MFVRSAFVLSILCAMPSLTNGQATDLDREGLADITEKVLRSEEKAMEGISEAFPDEREKLRSLLAKMKTQGPFALPREEVMIIREKGGYDLVSHMVLLMQVDAAALPSGMKVDPRWRTVLALHDLLALDQSGLRRVVYASRAEVQELYRQARVLTAGNEQPPPSHLADMKQNDLLRDRLMDYLEGEHSRTRKVARDLPDQKDEKKEPEKEAKPPVKNVRTWHDRTGKFSVDAAYAGYEPGTVKLQKPDRSTIDVPLEKLSFEDQKFVREMIREQKEKQERDQERYGSASGD